MAKEKSTVEISKEHFAPFIEAKAQLDKKIKIEGEKATKAFFKEYFDKHPEIYGVKWMQYTPYFNDGDPCTFSLSGVYTFTTKAAFEDTEDSLYNTEGAEKCFGEEPQSSLEEVEDILQVVFGDHALVAVTRDEITTEEYEHD